MEDKAFEIPGPKPDANKNLVDARSKRHTKLTTSQ